MLDNSFELYYYNAAGNWWFVGKWMIIHSLLKRVLKHIPYPTILDIGCGTGEVLERLSRYGFAVGFDISTEALTYSYLRGSDLLIQGDTFHMPFRAQTFDVLVILDLFEHLKDDLDAMRMFTDLLKPGGYIIMTVPADPGLWSIRDEKLHHYRRYTRDELRRIIEMSGLRVERLFHRNFLLHPIVWFKYKREKLLKKTPDVTYDLVVVPRLINWLLIKTLAFETKLLEHVDLPAGSSLVCLARKE